MRKQIVNVAKIISAFVLLFSLVACGASSVSSDSGIMLKPGEVISFANNVAGGAEDGWSVGPDNGGTWTASDKATLNFKYEKEFEDGLVMSLDLISFVNDKNPKIDLTLKANGVQVGSFNFNQASPGGEIKVNIDSKTLKVNPGILLLEFDVPNSISPKEIGLNEDIRDLGIFLKSITPSKF